MQTILTVVHLFLAIGLVGLVLIQHGKGADAGAAFGSGASATVFGARGSANFLSRSTGVLAALFFVTSMALAYYATQVTQPQSLMDGVETPAAAVGTPPVPGGETGVPPAEPSDVPLRIGTDASLVPAAGEAQPATAVPAVPEAPASAATPEPAAAAASVPEPVAAPESSAAEVPAPASAEPVPAAEATPPAVKGKETSGQ
jgi:preprotein translocase subunit SecG